MSTRAGIIVTDGSDSIHFYRHSDGYPKGTMPTLRQFLNLVKKGLIRNNVSQASGWLILIGAKSYNYELVKVCTKCGTPLKKNKKKRICSKCKSDVFEHVEKDLPLEAIFNPKHKNRMFGTEWKVGAYELTPNVNLHGDLAYIYTVDIKELTITYKEV